MCCQFVQFMFFLIIYAVLLTRHYPVFLFFLEVEDFNITFKSTQSYSLADQTALLLEYKLNQQGPSTGLPKAFHLLPLCIRLQCLQLSVSKDIKTLFHMLLLANSM